MVRVTLDGVAVKAGLVPALSFSAPGNWEGRYAVHKLALESCPANDAALGDVAQVLSTARYNGAEHLAVIEAAGCEVFRGQAVLEKVVRSGRQRAVYNMELREKVPGWIQAARSQMFNEIPIDFECRVLASSVYESWTWDRPVRFLPVQREQTLVKNASGTLIPPAVVLNQDNYHPFIHVASALRAIIEGAGYKLTSQFADGELFRSLYMSGNYPGQDLSKIKRQIDFLAGRAADRTTTVNSNGKVMANPLISASSVGNLVDTADPAVVAGAYNTNNAFRIISSRAAFVPPAPVQVCFEVYLNYRTEYSILSRGELRGVNRVTLCDSTAYDWKLVNRFRDMRMNPAAAMAYRCLVFDYTPGTSYQLRYDRVVNQSADMDNLKPADVVNMTLATFSARSAAVTVPAGYRVANMTLWAKASGAAAYTEYPGDWALYEGWVTETGTTEVEITLRTAAVNASPASPAYFDAIYFDGGIAGSSFTMLGTTWIRPVLSSSPAIEEKIGFADIAAHPVRQSALIDALVHMFDLRFITDEQAREVFMEPYASLAFGDEPADWSALADGTAAVEISEPGAGMKRTTTLCYRSGDQAQMQYDSDNRIRTGYCSFGVESALASGQSVVENPLFAPTLSIKGSYPDAPGAWIMQAGKREGDFSLPDDSLNFIPKIVSYKGLVDLPRGEVWGWPAYSTQYPLAAFHYPGGEPFTLCFEDRDGAQGLHVMHEGKYEQLNRQRRIVMRMNLTPTHVEELIKPGAVGGFFRPVKIVVAGEPVVCRLEAVEEWTAGGTQSAKCTFITI